MKIYIKIKNDITKDIKFETLDCAAAISSASMLTETVKGKSLNEALKVTKDGIVKKLGGLPPRKLHCPMMVIEALHKAIEDYKTKTQKAPKFI